MPTMQSHALSPHFSLLQIAYCLLSLCCLLCDTALMSADMGSEWLKVATFRTPNSPPEIVLNDYSQRKTAAVFGQRNDERFFGENAHQLSGRFPANIVWFSHLLLGLPFNHTMQNYMQDTLHLTYNFTSNPDRGTIDVTVDNDTYSMEEIVSLMVRSMRSHAQKQLSELADTEVAVSGVVLVVPAHYTLPQRESLGHAMTLAGLQVKGIMHRTTAAALQFALQPRDSSKKHKRNIMVFDVGAMSVEVAVVSILFHQTRTSLGKLKVKAVVSEPLLGGKTFDTRLAAKLATLFQESSGYDITDINSKQPSLESQRALVRLMDTANNVKEKLSANSEFPVMLEAFWEDKPLPETFITREMLEDLTVDLIDRTISVARQALRKANFAKGDITKLCIVGGGSRIPKLQSRLVEFFHRDVDRTLNSDEAAALGAAQYASSLVAPKKGQPAQTTFEIEDLYHHTVVYYAVSKANDTIPIASKVLLDPQTDRKNSLLIKSASDFYCTLFYEDSYTYNAEDLESPKVPWVQYYISGVEEFQKAYDTEEGDERVVEMKFNFNKTNDRLSLQYAVAKYKPVLSSKATKGKTPSEIRDLKTKATKVSPRLPIQANHFLPKPMTKPQLKAASSRLKAVRRRDADKLEIAEHRNRLATVVYNIKNELIPYAENPIIQAELGAPSIPVEKVNEQMCMIEDWLEAEDEDRSLGDYKGKLAVCKPWQAMLQQCEAIIRKFDQPDDDVDDDNDDTDPTENSQTEDEEESSKARSKTSVGLDKLSRSELLELLQSQTKLLEEHEDRIKRLEAMLSNKGDTGSAKDEL